MRRLFRLLLVAGVLGGLWVLLRELLEEQDGQTREAGSRAPASEAPASEAKGPTDGAGSVSKAELYRQAQQLDVQGRSKMNREELARAVGEARGGGGR
ncbi:MAG: hypothetical protein ACRDL6_01445 [Solirubrobacterales bacterium]